MAELWQSPDRVWTYDGLHLHLDVPQLLKVSGLEDTQENRDLATILATHIAAERWPDTPITITE